MSQHKSPTKPHKAKPSFAPFSNKPHPENRETFDSSSFNAVLALLFGDIPEMICSTCAVANMPTEEQIERLKSGDLVKVRFADDKYTEYMWVQITKVDNGTFAGNLDNVPFLVDGLAYGDSVEFERDRIHGIY